MLKQKLDFEERQQIKNCEHFVRWNIPKLCVVPSARRLLLYAPVPVVWNESKRLRLPICTISAVLANYRGILLINDDGDEHQVNEMTALEFVVST